MGNYIVNILNTEENYLSQSINLVDNDSLELRRAKRRRRDLTLDCKSQQLQPSQLTDQASPTTTKRSSKFHGVSKHRWINIYEAHLWDKLSWNVTQKEKGNQGRAVKSQGEYRGVARHHYKGKREAQTGKVFGNTFIAFLQQCNYINLTHTKLYQ